MKLLAVAQPLFAVAAVAEQVWPLAQYDETYPTFTINQPIIPHPWGVALFPNSSSESSEVCVSCWRAYMPSGPPRANSSD
ncbi:hypothetical protein F5Y17DRAFT_463774 [Xylariaceae sp. FL0594]|nr:hypothetical protein F5Y17DRAFT_463774 [Xylariaceae sp. FL0594]